MSAETPKAYEPAEVEPSWYAFWVEQGVFRASDDPADTRPVYFIPMPPPNVTGSLHMGHALHGDARRRAHPLAPHARLQHALAARASITRASPRRPWSSGSSSARARRATTSGARSSSSACGSGRPRAAGASLEQQRVLGASPDWTRTQVHDGSRPVARGARSVRAPLRRGAHLPRDAAHQLVPRVPRPRSRDLEVENEEGANGELFEFAYKVDGDGRARSSSRPRVPRRCSATPRSPCTPTTRATSTCTARSSSTRSSIGKIPIITDAILVDPKFGTGAVKVTPAHDFNDFATGKRHGLEEINIFNLDGTMNEQRRPVRGPRPQARAQGREEARSTRRASRAAAKPHLLTLPRVPALGRRRRADDLDAVVREDEAAGRAGASKAVRDGAHRDHPRGVDEDVRPLAARTSRTGASRASSGGATGSRRGTARTATITVARERRPPARVRRRAGRKTRTCSTRGSRAGSGRSRRWAGPNETPRSRSSIPRAIWRRATTSCSSGSPA